MLFRSRPVMQTGANPSSPVGGAPTLKWALTYQLAKLSKKLQEIEKILGHEKGRHALEAPAPRSANSKE